MTAHELAKALLTGPDLPVIISTGEMGDLEEVISIDHHIPKDGLRRWSDTHWVKHDEPALELRS